MSAWKTEGMGQRRVHAWCRAVRPWSHLYDAWWGWDVARAWTRRQSVMRDWSWMIDDAVWEWEWVWVCGGSWVEEGGAK